MGCSGWSAVQCVAVRGAGRSLSVSLFSGLCRSVRLRAPSRGRTALFRLRRAPPLVEWPLHGSGWPRKAGPAARTSMYELGCPLLDAQGVSSIGLGSCPPSRTITGGGRDHMRPVARCSGGGGLTCSGTKPRSVVDVSPWWGGQASIGALGLRPLGARRQPARAKQGAPRHNQDHHRERGDTHEHEACGIT